MTTADPEREPVRRSAARLVSDRSASQAQVVVPDDPRRDGSEGTPSFCDRVQLIVGRARRRSEEIHRPGRESPVAVGPHVGT